MFDGGERAYGLDHHERETERAAHVHRGYGQGLAVFGVVIGTGLAIVIGWIVSYVVGRRVHLPPS